MTMTPSNSPLHIMRNLQGHELNWGKMYEYEEQGSFQNSKVFTIERRLQIDNQTQMALDRVTFKKYPLWYL